MAFSSHGGGGQNMIHSGKDGSGFSQHGASQTCTNQMYVNFVFQKFLSFNFLQDVIMTNLVCAL